MIYIGNNPSSQHTFPAKGQMANTSGFWALYLCYNYSTLPVQCKSSHRQYLGVGVFRWNFICGTKIWSYHFYISQHIFLLSVFYQWPKNVKVMFQITQSQQLARFVHRPVVCHLLASSKVLTYKHRPETRGGDDLPKVTHQMSGTLFFLTRLALFISFQERKNIINRE